MSNLNQYKKKRDFNKTKEPAGKTKKSSGGKRFVVQHHLASRDHFDFRLEMNGTLKSWAVPKGPSYNPADKRLAVLVEDHPLDYRNFEGTIPKDSYGGGTVMIWDEGTWEDLSDSKDKSMKFILKGKRLKGKWSLVHMKDDNWLLIKEKDAFSNERYDIKKYKTSIKTGRTMDEIANNIEKIDIEISNPDKIIFEKDKITKNDIFLYYQKVSLRMILFLEKRIISTVRCPQGTKDSCFFKKHLDYESEGIVPITIKNSKNENEEYYYIDNINGLLAEVQMNTIEFHPWGSKIDSLEKPDVMVFDLDPDENMDLKDVRIGVKDLKSILDDLSLVSFLKTSGGKGYHIVIPIKSSNWKKFREFAKRIAEVMEKKWPNKYTTNIRKDARKGKIFIDWIRNTRSSTSIAPYSIRAKEKATISMPIRWSELDKIAPNEITMGEAIKRLKRTDPWMNFFTINQRI